MQRRILQGRKLPWLAAAFLLLMAFRGFAAEPLTLRSPSGNLAVTFAIKSNPQPYLPGARAYYSVAYDGRPILADSPTKISPRSEATVAENLPSYLR